MTNAALMHPDLGDLETIGRREFDAALYQLTMSSCCSPGLHCAAATGSRSVLAKIGYAGWRAGVKPARSRLPIVRGRFVLPDVAIASTRGTAREHVDVFVDDRRIAKVVRAGSLAYGGWALVEAARGHTLAPSLVDMHAHMPPKNVLHLTPLFLLLNLRFGVTQLRDAGDLDGTSVPAALELVESGALPGPHLQYCDAFVTSGDARWANSIPFDEPAQARSIVEGLAHSGATWIKSYENLDAPRIAALVSAAEDAGLGVMGHVPSALTVEEALLPDSQHFFGVPLPYDLRRHHILNRALDWHNVDERRLEAIVAAASAHDLAFTPTFAAHSGFMRTSEHATESRAADVTLLPRFYADVIWSPQHGLPSYRNVPHSEFERARAASAKKKKLAAMLASAGVTLRLGTDTQQPFVVPGIAMHTEISVFLDAGIDRSTAWEWASTKAGKTLGIEGFGCIEEGGLAELVVCDGSPYASGWTHDAIAAVVVAGGYVTRTDMDDAVRSELRRFEGRIMDYVTHWLARAALQQAAKNFVD